MSLFHLKVDCVFHAAQQFSECGLRTPESPRGPFAQGQNHFHRNTQILFACSALTLTKLEFSKASVTPGSYAATALGLVLKVSQF